MKFEHPKTGTLRVRLTMNSRNPKTGPIPVSTTSAETCPDACPLKTKGCYAASGPLALIWRETTEGKFGDSWETFCKRISGLPTGTLWRHNQAGDLPGEGNVIDRPKLDRLVQANYGLKGFTYTHKPVLSPQYADNLQAIRDANAQGFVINLSADTLAEADQLAETGLPVVVLQDAKEGEKHNATTPAGRKVVTCPATYLPNVTCQTCKLCANGKRNVIIGFPVHGSQAKTAAQIASGS